ncbi:MAG: ABC transporter substrate-binding protein [bacterium]|nr:ABC transporter substrate-binding protein [bacterium]
MKRTIAIIIALAAAAAAEPPVPGEGRTLRLITDFNSPPFSYKEGMKRTGFEIDLGEAIAKELGAKAEWIQRSFNIAAVASSLDADAADAAIMSISITEPRKRQLAFSVPYYRSSLALAVQHDVHWRRDWMRGGMKHWEIGVMRGTTAEKWARKNLTGRIKTYATPERLVQALRDSRHHEAMEELGADERRSGFCIIIDEDILAHLLAKHGYRFRIAERRIHDEDYGIAVSREDPELLAEINAALRRLDQSGVYDTLHEKWFMRRTDLPSLRRAATPRPATPRPSRPRRGVTDAGGGDGGGDEYEGGGDFERDAGPAGDGGDGGGGDWGW